MLYKIALFSLLYLISDEVVAFRTQSVAVKGKLLCGGVPARDVHVKLYDQDDGPDPDDMYDQMLTNDDGEFSLSGSGVELTPIDPEIRIYHSCNNHGNPCPREWVIQIPNKYIYSGPKAAKAMDVGTLNLEMIYQTVILLIISQIVYSIDIAEQHTGKQSYKVRGYLICGDKPATDVEVKLVDDDFGPDPDDVLASKHTDEDGYFELEGFTTELTTIDPHLKIYHDCNDGIIPCQRRWAFELPNHYITSGPRPEKVLDIGTWNLEMYMPGESHDCVH
ncbi:hypothetical protein WR25_03975 [Diploscapter pachys]|uniref:Uncharacterized protein n=1 Tax=Diploscapter pachys TaxID=2018661 RepID=A0A2A2KEW0_9BILA|nr:hypothetical protein WR25_03975 [Diploscapter pachys]